MADIKTITLDGSEQTVKISGQNCSITNDGSSTIYASARNSIVPEADGVLEVPAGTSAMLLDSRGSVSLLGTGKVRLYGTDYMSNPVNISAPSSSGGNVPDDYEISDDSEVKNIFS
jgi:hypothetical protein